MTPEDAQFYEDRIENYKSLLRDHYREGERLKRELVALERARHADRSVVAYLCPRKGTSLSFAARLDIRRKYALGVPITVLCREFRRAQSTIRNVVRGAA